MGMEDFINFEFFLSNEELQIKENTRKFVEEKFLPLIKDAHRNGYFPKEIVKDLGEMGFLGAPFKSFNLPGLSPLEYGLVMLELERGDSGLRSFVSVQNSLVMYPILNLGSDAQKNYYIPKLARGEIIGCYGLTEPNFGSNPGGMRSYLKKEKGGYLLNGAKSWITNGSISDISIVWAKDEEGKVRAVIVEKGMKGFESREIKGKFSLRASDTGELFFEDVYIDEDHILPETNSLKHPLSCLNEARYGIAWGAIGSALFTSEYALNYAKERIQFKGKPIASHQIIQEKLAYMVTEISKAFSLMIHLSKLKENNLLKYWQVSLAKRNNVYIARECARLAREILGAQGIVDEHPIIRHMLNLESVYTYEGTHDIHTLVIGEHLTSIKAYNPPEED